VCQELGVRCEPSFPPSKPARAVRITDFT